MAWDDIFMAGADPNNPQSYSALEMRRKIAMQMMSQKKGYPKTLGEGLTSIGDAIGDIGMMKMLERQEALRQKGLAATATTAEGTPAATPPAASPARSVGPQASVNPADVSDAPVTAPQVTADVGISPADADVGPQVNEAELQGGRAQLALANQQTRSVVDDPANNPYTGYKSAEAAAPWFNDQANMDILMKGSGGAATGVPSPNQVSVAQGGVAPVVAQASNVHPNVQSWYDFSRRPVDQGGLGLTHEQAVGKVANLQAESGPTISLGATGDKGTAHGAAQWRLERWNNLNTFAQANGMNPNSVEAQQAFMRHEYLGKPQDGPGGGSEGRAYRALTAAQTPQDAASAVNRFYERSADTSGRREAGAVRLAGTLGGNQQQAAAPAAPTAPQQPFTAADAGADARFKDVVGMSGGPTGAYSYPPTASLGRVGDVMSDAPQPGITGGASKIGPSVVDTVQQRDEITKRLLEQQQQTPAPVVPQENPTVPGPTAPTTSSLPSTLAATTPGVVGSPKEAAANPPITMRDFNPLPAEPAAAPGVQTAQYKPPEIIPRPPASAVVQPPPVTPQTASPLPGQQSGVYEKPAPPPIPPDEPKSPRQVANEAALGKAIAEGDPDKQRIIQHWIGLDEQARAAVNAKKLKEYESERTLYDQKYRAWEDAQRKLPETAEDLKKKRYEVQQQAEQDQIKNVYGNLPPHVHTYLGEAKKNAQSAVSSLESIRNAREVMDAGTLFGVAAPVKLAYYQALAEAGNKDAARIVAATQTYKTALGPVAAQAIKSYGGTQISNEDRRQGMAMAGADVSLDEKTARRMLDIAERSAKFAIQEHRENLDLTVRGQPGEAWLRRSYDVPDPMPAIPADKAKAEVREFNSIAEAEAAKLERGTKIKINGKPFKVQ